MDEKLPVLSSSRSHRITGLQFGTNGLEALKENRYDGVITETIGLDVGDRYSRYQVLGQADGEDAGWRAGSDDASYPQQLFAAYPQARVVLEVGTHSRWISEIAEASCAEVLVANPRKLRFIYGNDRKSDRSRRAGPGSHGRLDPNLLAPIRHRAESTQRTWPRSVPGPGWCRHERSEHAAGVIKSFGFRFPPMATECIGRRRWSTPGELRSQLGPLLVAIEALSGEIASYDAQIKELAASHPEALLTQVHGVGALTALAFLLTIEDRDSSAAAVAGAFTEASRHAREVVGEIVKTVGGGILKLPAKLLGKAVEGLGFLWRRPDEVAAEGASA
ncbi:MAG: hypothetical protein R3E85_02535 [Planctomycetota bacterium]